MKVNGDSDLQVTGHDCRRGETYAREEVKNPLRVVTSTVRVAGAIYPRCPVKTSGAIPKPLIFEAVRLLNSVDLRAPVEAGQVVVGDICGTGVQFVTTRSLPGAP